MKSVTSSVDGDNTLWVLTIHFVSLFFIGACLPHKGWSPPAEDIHYQRRVVIRFKILHKMVEAFLAKKLSRNWIKVIFVELLDNVQCFLPSLIENRDINKPLPWPFFYSTCTFDNPKLLGLFRYPKCPQLTPTIPTQPLTLMKIIRIKANSI